MSSQHLQVWQFFNDPVCVFLVSDCKCNKGGRIRNEGRKQDLRRAEQSEHWQKNKFFPSVLLFCLTILFYFSFLLSCPTLLPYTPVLQFCSPLLSYTSVSLSCPTLLFNLYLLLEGCHVADRPEALLADVVAGHPLGPGHVDPEDLLELLGDDNVAAGRPDALLENLVKGPRAGGLLHLSADKAEGTGGPVRDWDVRMGAEREASRIRVITRLDPLRQHTTASQAAIDWFSQKFYQLKKKYCAYRS